MVNYTELSISGKLQGLLIIVHFLIELANALNTSDGKDSDANRYFGSIPTEVPKNFPEWKKKKWKVSEINEKILKKDRLNFLYFSWGFAMHLRCLNFLAISVLKLSSA